MATIFLLVALLTFIPACQAQLVMPSRCSLPPADQGSRCSVQIGGTNGVVQAYTYRNGQCISFVYAGCGGNANRFTTFAECQRTCLSTGITTASPAQCFSDAQCPFGQVCQRIACITFPCPPNTCVLNTGTSTTCTKANEFYTTCGSCEKTCTNQNPICTANCQAGCRCRAGYVRNAAQECVLPTQCTTGNGGTCSTLPTVDPRCQLTNQRRSTSTGCWSYTVYCP